MNQLPPSEAPVSKKRLGKGCLISLIVMGVFLLLFIILVLNCKRFARWGLTMGTGGIEHALVKRSPAGYDTTRIHAVFDEYRGAFEEGRVKPDSFRNLTFYFRMVSDTSQPLDTFKINQILFNFKGAVFHPTDSLWMK